MVRVAALLGIALLATGAPSLAPAAEWKDWAPKKGVWRFEEVKLDPNKIDAYMLYLKNGGEIEASKELKRLGIIDEFTVMVKLTPFDGMANVILGQHFVSYSALDPVVLFGPEMQKHLSEVAASHAPKGAVAPTSVDKQYVADEFWEVVDFDPTSSGK